MSGKISPETDPLFPQQGKETNAISTSTYVLRYISGGYALLLLGPHSSSEASSVLKTVRFYKKFMVRKKVRWSFFVNNSSENGIRDLVSKSIAVISLTLDEGHHFFF